MKKKDIVTLIAGMALGAALTGGAAAAGILAEPSWSPIYVDGQQVQMIAYNIAGNNFVKLRDIGQAVGFNVYYQNGVQVDSDAPYTGIAPVSTAVQASTPATTHAVQSASEESIRISCYKEGTLAAGDSSGLMIYPSGVEYTVTSSNPAVVKVEQTLGKFWKAAAMAPGTATITATAPDGRSGTVQVTVQGELVKEPLDLSANMDVRLKMVEYINQTRRENGLAELPINEALMNTAQDVSSQCVTEHRPYDHQALLRYGWPHEGMFNLTMFGYDGCPDIARQAIDYWIASPGHFETMLMEEAACVGTGVTYDSGRAYCYMVVGNPDGHNPYE